MPLVFVQNAVRFMGRSEGPHDRQVGGMSRFIRIKSPGELVEAIKRKPSRFLVMLGYGGTSSKQIRYDHRRRVFKVRNLIDGSRQELTCAHLMSPRHSNIGPAMRGGAFYAEV